MFGDSDSCQCGSSLVSPFLAKHSQFVLLALASQVFNKPRIVTININLTKLFGGVLSKTLKTQSTSSMQLLWLIWCRDVLSGQRWQLEWCLPLTGSRKCMICSCLQEPAIIRQFPITLWLIVAVYRKQCKHYWFKALICTNMTTS